MRISIHIREFQSIHELNIFSQDFKIYVGNMRSHFLSLHSYFQK